MPAIGKKHPLVTLIYQKTKIRKEDIVDMFKVLPECMAEAFYMANPGEGEAVDLGGINLRWKLAGKWGSAVSSNLTKPMKSHLVRVKVEKRYPLAAELFDIMNQKNRERAVHKQEKAKTTTLS